VPVLGHFDRYLTHPFVLVAACPFAWSGSLVAGEACDQLVEHDPASRGAAAEVSDQIIAEAKFSGVTVDWVPQDQLATVLDIAARSMAIEVNDHDLFDETLQWCRFSDREISLKGDGLHVDTSGSADCHWSSPGGSPSHATGTSPTTAGLTSRVSSTRSKAAERCSL